MSEPLPERNSDLPRLGRDAAFLGMTVTQFLGAFNDNLFKQLILLWCLDLPGMKDVDYQGYAGALFSIPFILFSGFAGYLADRNSKRTIVVLCKAAEIAIMALGVLAFWRGSVAAVFSVLFLMGTHSAFFGPAKYGILPELLRRTDLPAANGVIQMTTFLAIIFGTASAGQLMDLFGRSLWMAVTVCVLIALVGTITSLLVRRTPIAQPTLEFRWSSLAIGKDTLQVILADKLLLTVFLIVTVFWFVAGLVHPSVNAVGKNQLHLADGETSLLVACVGFGIAAGCVLAGKLSANRVRFELATVGALGMTACFILLGLPGEQAAGPAMGTAWFAGAALTVLGLFAGLFAVPLQVFLQTRPPESQKGRAIATMNLLNFIGIFLAFAFYGVCQNALKASGMPPSRIFLIAAGIMLAVGLFFRPKTGDQ